MYEIDLDAAFSACDVVKFDDEKTATVRFYASRVYDEEIRTGTITYPEEAF